MADAESKKTPSRSTQKDLVFVNPFYHEAKNEITRPDRTVFCSQYFISRWLPRLGPTAFGIVLYLRSLGGSVREGEVALQINQDDIAKAVQCSDRTVRREIAENKELQRFVRIEERYERGERGRIRRLENVYFVAMDDPLAEEDEPILQAIISRKKVPQKSERKIISPADVIGQNVRVRDDVIGQIVLLRHEIGEAQNDPTVEDKLSEQKPKDSESYRNVSESRFRGVSETDSGNIPIEEKAKRLAQKYGGDAPQNGPPRKDPMEKKNKSENTPGESKPPPVKNPAPRSGSHSSGENTLEAWRKKSEELARYSASELGDQPSLGFHIKVWNHARKTDRRQPEGASMAAGLFGILQNLIERRQQTGLPQGKAWTRRIRKFFDENDCPMLLKSDEAELEEVREALKDAPFLRDI